MHIYQKHILDLLRRHESLRYSQLQPLGVESSHFKYHLNQLLKEGVVTQLERGLYTLTLKGAAALDVMSESSVIPAQTPKLITYTLLENNDCFFLQKKLKQPYRGLLNMVGGKVHIGESAEQAATRELKEKIDFQAERLHLCAIAEIRIDADGALYTHVVAYVFRARMDAVIAESKKLVSVPKKSIQKFDTVAPDFIPIIDSLHPDTVSTPTLHLQYKM